MKSEHSGNMLIGGLIAATLVAGLGWRANMKMPTDEEIVEAIPVLEVEPTPFDFACWSGKTEIVRYVGLVEAERFTGGSWRLVKKDSPETFYTPRRGELCGVLLQ